MKTKKNDCRGRKKGKDKRNNKNKKKKTAEKHCTDDKYLRVFICKPDKNEDNRKIFMQAKQTMENDKR